MEAYPAEVPDKLHPLVAVIASDGPVRDDGQQTASTGLLQALQAASAADTGPSLRFRPFPTQYRFPPRKQGRWLTPDGARVSDSFVPGGILKRRWLDKHSYRSPSVVLHVAKMDLSLSPGSWAQVEAAVVADVQRLAAELAPREARVMLCLLQQGATTALGRDSHEIVEQRLLSMRRLGVDPHMLTTLAEYDLGLGSMPLWRLGLQLKELAARHYEAAITRLRRQEKLLLSTQSHPRLLPLLARVHFKLGCMSEAVGGDDRAVAAFHECARVLGDMMALTKRANADAAALPGTAGEALLRIEQVDSTGLLLEGDHVGQIRGVAEVVHVRLMCHHLRRALNVDAALLQFRRHVATFGTNAMAPTHTSVPLAACARHAWLSHQHHVLATMLLEHTQRFPMMSGGQANVMHHLLAAASHAVRRRKVAAKLLVDPSFKLSDHATQEYPWFGAGLQLLAPSTSPLTMDQSAAVRYAAMGEELLKAQEAGLPHADISAALLKKALALMTDHSSGGALHKLGPRQRTSVTCTLGEELEAGRHCLEALKAWSAVPEALQDSSWNTIAAAVLPRICRCAAACDLDGTGTAAHQAYVIAASAVDAGLRLAGRTLQQLVPPAVRQEALATALTAAFNLAAALSPDLAQQSTTALALPCGPLSAAVDGGLEVALGHHHDMIICAAGFAVGSATAGESVLLHLFVKNFAGQALPVREVQLQFSSPLVGCRIVTSSAVPTGEPPAHLSGNYVQCSCLASVDAGAPLGLAKQQFTCNMLNQVLAASTCVRLTLDVRLPPALASQTEPLSVTGVRFMLSPPHLNTPSVTLAVPARDASLLQREVPPHAGLPSQHAEVRVLPPVARAQLGVLSSGDPALVGALTPITLTIASHGDHVEGGHLYLECNPAPASYASSHAFFWQQQQQQQQQRQQQPQTLLSPSRAGLRGFEPLPLGSNLQPAKLALMAGMRVRHAAAYTHAVTIWARALSTVPVAISFRLEYGAAGVKGGLPHNSQLLHVLQAQPPLVATAEVISRRMGNDNSSSSADAERPASDAAAPATAAVLVAHRASLGAAPDVTSPLPVFAHEPFEVRLALTTSHSLPLRIKCIELVPPSRAAAAASSSVQLIGAQTILYGAPTDREGHSASAAAGALLCQNDVISAGARMIMAAPGLSTLGVLRVRWCAEEMPPAMSVSSIQEQQRPAHHPVAGTVITELPLPTADAVEATIMVDQRNPSEAYYGGEFEVVWCITNCTNLHQEVTMQASGGEGFVWSGSGTHAMQLQPGESTEFAHALVPLALGHVALPQTSFTCKSTGSVLLRSQNPSSSMFVVP
eukprot:TRINITY_DN3182_c1_g1_i1.p1 TRINITY_DN3182_c1_g1~~TRINITY_DN3182_c1_g1_i1.p1  ORF type:complete len:1314 (+),score=408.04 TRINITY_DN3182_c1_g1_i1:183-4124(+)